ncbi:uncharacterized protein LOC142575559 isoform X1 [Dermacentor variabilis]|uniref:uncharacterized protein LOC142575559 isoform X1 n=1 Tax=Dermacentor variabilis TaxID=34621 RepID=UPI003F5B1852
MMNQEFDADEVITVPRLVHAVENSPKPVSADEWSPKGFKEEPAHCENRVACSRPVGLMRSYCYLYAIIHYRINFFVSSSSTERVRLLFSTPKSQQWMASCGIRSQMTPATPLNGSHEDHRRQLLWRGFSKMTHPGDVFAVDCLRSILPSEGIVAEMNEDYKDAVQAHRINDANLSLQIDDMGKAAQSFANEPKTGHAAQIVNTAFPENTIQISVSRWYDDGTGDQALPFGSPSNTGESRTSGSKDS